MFLMPIHFLSNACLNKFIVKCSQNTDCVTPSFAKTGEKL